MNRSLASSSEATAALTIPFGQRLSDGRIVTASETPRGEACGCVCPACGRRLQAHQGQIVSWHFQHVADAGFAAECSGGTESGLHKFAKQVIAEKQAVFLPPLIATHGYVYSTVQPGRWMRARNVRLEVPVPDADRHIIPDVMVEVAARNNDGALVWANVLIEIVVTHRATNEKREFLRDNRLPAFEINLSAFLQNPKPTLYEYVSEILRDGWRYWLWHPRQDFVNAALETQIRDRELLKKKLVEQRRRFTLRNAEHKRYRAELERKREQLRAVSQIQNEISEYELHDARDIEIKRRERERWLREVKEFAPGVGAARELVEWNRDWRERIG
jgi:hypothetical protein